MLYISIFIILLYLSFRYDLMGAKTFKDFWYVFMLVVFILVAGLRYRLGEDTPNYLWGFYHKYPPLEKFSLSDFSIGSDPLWVLLNSIVKSIGGRFYHVQLIHATIINVLIFKYIKKHSSYIFTCLLFYAFCCYTNYNMQIMRASLSVVLCLFGNDYVLERKWFKGYVLYGIALFCHAQTILIFVLPFLFFMRLNAKGMLLLIFAFVAGKILQDSLGDYVFLLEDSDEIADKAEMYANSDDYGQGKSFKWLLLRYIMDIPYALLSLWYVKHKLKNRHLLRFEPFIMLGLLFLFVQFNFQIAYRFVDYYRIYFVLFFAEFFIGCAKCYLRMPIITAFVVMLLMFVPYVFIMGWGRSGSFDQYYPYSSVIERSKSADREKLYRSERRHGPRSDEY